MGFIVDEYLKKINYDDLQWILSALAQREIDQGYNRHSFISGKRNKGGGANVVTLHSNTSVQIINAHCDNHTNGWLLVIHNQIHPERKRTKDLNYKVITKKSRLSMCTTMYLFKKLYIILLID